MFVDDGTEFRTGRQLPSRLTVFAVILLNETFSREPLRSPSGMWEGSRLSAYSLIIENVGLVSRPYRHRTALIMSYSSPQPSSVVRKEAYLMAQISGWFLFPRDKINNKNEDIVTFMALPHTGFPSAVGWDILSWLCHNYTGFSCPVGGDMPSCLCHNYTGLSSAVGWDRLSWLCHNYTRFSYAVNWDILSWLCHNYTGFSSSVGGGHTFMAVP